MNIFIILSIIGVSIIVIFYLIKRAYDNKKKLITKRVKIKRKVVKSKNVEWYIR